MSTTEITRAAFERLLTFVFNPQPEIMWPGLESNPPAVGIWLQPEMFHNEPDDIAWDDDSCVKASGFLQILVHYRPGEGTVEPIYLADALIVHYPKGSALGPVRVVKRAWQGEPVVDSDDVFIPVTVPFMGLM